MGEHRAGGASRGVARWLIAVVVALIVVITIVIGMIWLSGRSAQEGRDAAATCVRGDLKFQIAASPALVEALRRVADSFNESGTVAGDYCPKAEVTGVDAPVALAALSGTWDDKLGPVPALWIPTSTTWTARLAAAKPAELSSQPTSVASSPVVLAARTASRQSFDGVRWIDLPGRQADLRVTLPTGNAADGTFLAAQSVAAAVARTDGAALTAETVAQPQVTGTLNRWSSAAPKSESTNAALDKLAGSDDAVRAVPVTEQQLFAFSRGKGADGPIAVRPTGPTAFATYPAAVLDRDDLPDETDTAAAAFVTFVTKSENAKPLADAGFRVPGQNLPAKTDAVSFDTVTPLAPAPNPAVIAVADAVTAK